MLKVVYLIWTLILPDLSGHQTIETFRSIDECKAKGDEYAALSETMRQNKEIFTFHGQCFDTGIFEQPKGSI